MPDESVASKPISRRSALKVTTAVAAAGIVGIVVGVGGDMLLRPTSTTTQTTTQTQTATQTGPTVTATQTETATQTGPTTTATTTATKTATTTATTTTTTTAPDFPQTTQVLSSSCDNGPFMATVVNGVWAKSDPLVPNQNYQNTYGNGTWIGFGAVQNCRARTYSPDRIRYPMMRVGWVPGAQTAASVANRGTGQFVRITWDQAFAFCAEELNRIESTYGPGSIYHTTGGHQWRATVHTQAWTNSLCAALGGYTTKTGGSSTVGWQDGSPLIWGTAQYAGNNGADLLPNCKLMIFWSADPVRSNMTTASQSILQYYNAGVKFIVVDPRYNETMMMFPKAQWIPIRPGTDEALLAACAYYWITNNLINTAYIQKYTIGYDMTTLPAGTATGSSFSDYILGTGPDKTPKTPAWASAITGVPVATITALAAEWASTPTYVDCGASSWVQATGRNRAEYAGEWTRMIVACCAILGKIGVSGSGIGGVPADPTVLSVTGQVWPGTPPTIANPVTQSILHVNLAQAILNGKTTWTTGVTTKTYPTAAPVQMMWISGGSLTGQVPGMDNHHQALKSPNLQFIMANNPWWEDPEDYADVVLPVQYMGEHDDVICCLNYTIYMNQLIQPLYESLSDFEIVQGIANALGGTYSQQVFQGMDKEQWVQWSYAQSNVPLTFAQFQAQQVYEYQQSPPSSTPNYGGLQNFITNPTANPLTTPSGKIELYSAQIVKAYGVATPNADGSWSGQVYSPTNSKPTAWAVPTYVNHTEDLTSPTSAALVKQLTVTVNGNAVTPMLLTNGGTPNQRHSQWGNMTWIRDEMQTFLNGYRVIWINASDAAARGLSYGQLVKVYNNRGAIVCAARPTQRVGPGVVWLQEGGHSKSVDPGTTGVGIATQTTNPTTMAPIDIGSNDNYLCEPWQNETICGGMSTHSGLVQIVPWTE